MIVNGNNYTVFPSSTGHRFIGTDLPPFTYRDGDIIIKLNDLNVDGFEDSQYGGAMRLVDTHLEAKNCQFTRNRAEERGGALRTENDNVVYFENCEFTGNRIKQDSGLLARGGAISITDYRTRLIVRSSKFADNKREGLDGPNDFIDCKDTDHCVIDTITTDVPITTQNIHLKKAMACPAPGVDFDIGTQFSNLGTDYNFCKAGQTCFTGWTDYSIVCTDCTNCCAYNEKVVSNACVACPAGAKRPAGDDPTGADTVCLSVPCGHNERVVNNSCVACAASTFNDAGDDPTGPDTTCLVLAPLTNDDRDYYNPGSCTENERLVSGECADCPLGLSNPFEFMADDTVFYSEKPCANTTDCEQKCTADKSCEGYSYYYGIDNNRVQKSKIGSTEYNIDISGVIDMVGNERAFAVLVDGGGIKTFGSSSDGGSGPDVEITSGAKSIHSTKEAFAVLMTNGTIIAWGESAEGGDTTGLDLSSGFVSITSNFYAFAGLKSDGSVVVWGDSSKGGDTTGVDLSSNVVKIYSHRYAFAALKSDGSVVAWGRSNYGDGPTGIGAGSGVIKIFPNNGASSWEGSRNRNERAFVALLSNRTVRSWGDSYKGGNAPSDLTDVVNIYSTKQAFAALRFDGTVVGWGSSYNGASVPDGLSDVVDIFSTCCAFAALKSDGSVVAWGSSNSGGTDPGITSGVVKIFSNYAAFTALMEDGSVKVWGDSGYGGKEPNIVSGVSNIYTSFGAFAALKTDGSVWVWGDSSYGGIQSYESDAQQRLDRGSGISHVYACHYGFAYASLQGFRYGSKSSGFGKSFKLKGDDPSMINPLGYRIDDSVKYGSTACDNSTDCAQKCSADASCKGYTRSGGNLYTWGSFESGGLDPLLSGVTKVYSDYDGRSFHAIMYDGNIKSWGDTRYGGGGADPNAINVKYIVSNPAAAMALLEDGTIRSWGDINTDNMDGLTGATKIVTSYRAFAVLKSDGTVVSDGDNYYGGCNSGSYSSYTCNPDGLANVVDIFAHYYGFAALRSNGSLVSWGRKSFGGDTTGVDLSSGVVEVVATDKAWAARKSDGSVVAWGDSTDGGDASGVDLTSVTKIYSNEGAFAALKSDGSVVSWGDSNHGGTDPGITSGVTKIYTNRNAFAALKSDGTIVAWGHSGYGGVSPTGDFTGVVDIIGNDGAFVALKADGSVDAWGSSSRGGTAPTGLGGVTKIVANKAAVAALKSDGTVVTWGIDDYGGCEGTTRTSSYICKSSNLTGVTDIYVSKTAFAAITSIQSEYGPLIAGSGDSRIKNADTICGAGTPVGCAQNERVVSNECVPCPVATTNIAGDNPTGSDTTCDPILCGANLRVVNNDCVSCPPGTSNDAGDDSSGADTTCDPILCGANLRVVNNVCVSCPIGTENAAGDDASGADTTCDPILCGANEYVSSNVCTACPDTSTRSAGDDASGADTVCACAANEFLNATSQCEACATGTGGDGSVCDKCAENYHVSSNQCVACPDGTRPAGDDKNGADTQCACPTDKIMNATNQCDACPIGSGGDGSACDKCGTNYHVTQPGFQADNTKKYGGAPCDGSADCETKCYANATCAGYTTGFKGDILGSGGDAFCATLSGGTKCWGEGSSGMLGYGDSNNRGDGAGEMGTDLPYIAFAHTVLYIGSDRNSDWQCALLSNGDVECWGFSSYYSMGGTATSYSFENRNVAVSGAKAFSAGALHSCALMQAGNVKCWGLDNRGQLGDGVTPANAWSKRTITDVSNINNAIDIKAGRQHSCALLDTGKVMCWGQSYKVGVYNNDDQLSPVEVLDIDGVIQLEIGHEYTCVILNTGKIRCWGGYNGAIFGDDMSYDSTTSHNYKHTVSFIGDTLPKAVKVSIGYNHACAILENADLYCWGTNAQGQVGDGTTTQRNTPVKILSNVNDVEAGTHATCAIQDGSFKCWGKNNKGQMGQGDTTDRLSPVSVDLGAGFPSIDDTYGPLVAGTSGLGNSYTRQDKVCTACPHTSMRLSGDDPAAGVTECFCPANQFLNSTRHCEACADGYLGDGTACDKCDQNYRMSVAYSSSSNKYDGASCLDDGICNVLCSLDSNCTGYTLNDWKITWGDFYGPVAAVGGGMVYNWGRYTYQAWLDGDYNIKVFTPTKIPGITNAVDVAAGNNGGCALLADKTVSCWGRNKYTGNGGTDTTIKPPTVVAGLTDVVSLKGRGNAYCALLTDKNLKCWGYQGYSQFGIGNSNNQHTPVLAFGSNGDIEDFSVSSEVVCVIYTGGRLKCAGYNYYGQVGMGNSGSSYNVLNSPTQVKIYETGADVTDAVSVYGGHQHSCYVPTDGRLRCWGNGGYEVGSSGNDPTTKPKLLNPSVENPTWVTLGSKGGCAGVSNGDVYCWGENNGYDSGDDNGYSYPKLVFSGITGIVQQFGDMVFVSENGQVRSSGGSGSYGELGQGGTITYKSGWSNNGPVLLSSAGGSYGPLVNGTGNSKQKGAISCAACPSGTTLSSIGDITQGLGSFCTRDTACDQNEYVNVTHGCQTCADGNFNDLGDTTVSRCDDVYKCLVNEHVKTTFDSDSEKNYTGSSCSSASDCVTKCHGDAACAGYTEGEFTIGAAFHNYGLCVLLSSGKVKCLGTASNNYLGNQNNGATNKLTFIDVDNVDGSSDGKFAIALTGHGWGHHALMRDGSIMVWGNSIVTGYGSSTKWPSYLGTSHSYVDANTKITNAIKITAGAGNRAFAILDTGEMLGWGSQYYGSINPSASTDVYSRVTAGGYNFKVDGSTDEKSAVDVAIGLYFTCVLMKDGKLRCWGKNDYGQLGIGSGSTSDKTLIDNVVFDGQTPASTVSKMKKWLRPHVCVTTRR